jgi:hypothetical protein
MIRAKHTKLRIPPFTPHGHHYYVRGNKLIRLRLNDSWIIETHTFQIGGR